jgi:hypothetical protein
VLVNQQVAPSGFSDAGALWQNLGNFQIRSGTLYVRLSDAANGNVEADAIRIQWLGPLPSTPPIHGIHDPGIGDSSHGHDHSHHHFRPLPRRPRRDIDGDDICDHDRDGWHLGAWAAHPAPHGQTHDPHKDGRHLGFDWDDAGTQNAHLWGGATAGHHSASSNLSHRFMGLANVWQKVPDWLNDWL